MRVRVQYKVSLGRATDQHADQDLTQRVLPTIEGDLLLLERDYPLVLKIKGGKVWQTQSKIQRIDGDLAKGETVEVHSSRSVYRVRVIS